MKQDLPTIIKKTAAFLQKPMSDQDALKLADHLSFKNMKNNKAVNKEDFIEKDVQYVDIHIRIISSLLYNFINITGPNLVLKVGSS